MELIRELEAQLQSFHGMRHLWAELVANHEGCGISKEKLEQQQGDRLTATLGVAFTLAKEMNLSWCIEVSEARKYKEQITDLHSMLQERADTAKRIGELIHGDKAANQPALIDIEADVRLLMKRHDDMVAALAAIKSFSTDKKSRDTAAGALL